jgi:hypothetical protein
VKFLNSLALVISPQLKQYLFQKIHSKKPPLNKKRQKTTKKRSGSSPRVGAESQTAQAAERSFEVVFKFLIFRLDLLFLLYQDKRKRKSLKNKVV